MLSKFFKLIRLDKTYNLIDLFLLGGIIEREDCNIINEKKSYLDVISIAGFGLSMSLVILFVSSNYIAIIILLLVLALFLFNIYVMINFTTNKSVLKFYKKIIKKKFNVNIKDPEFQTFIGDNFAYIRNQRLSKKETISLINDWEDNKEEVNKGRLKLKKEKDLNKIKELEEEIKGIKDAK